MEETFVHLFYSHYSIVGKRISLSYTRNHSFTDRMLEGRAGNRLPHGSAHDQGNHGLEGGDGGASQGSLGWRESHHSPRFNIEIVHKKGSF